MSGQDDEQTSSTDQQPASSAPTEPSEEGKKEVRRMAAAYEDRPTAVMPGTGGTVTGTAVNDWLDDEGNPKFGEVDDNPEAKDSPGGTEGEPQKPPD
jgi:hypothetical protein